MSMYVQATLHVPPENLEEWYQIFKDELLPLWEKRYTKLGGQWVTQLGPIAPREITSLWVYEDRAHWAKACEARAKDEESRKIVARMLRLMLDNTTKVLSPTPFSPLQ